MSGTGVQAPIIKKIKKKGHEGAHGGSWKVAYADFVTAMMAFFLVLWLISMVSEDRRARVSQYFKNFSLFEKGGQSFMMEHQKSESVIDIDINDAEGGSSDSVSADSFSISSPGSVAGPGDPPADEIKERLKNEIRMKLSDMKDQILIDTYEGAVRIEVVDKNDGTVMFNSGSSEMTDGGRKALRVIAQGIKDLKGKIALEGHTDASTYAGSRYSNWELSTERASAARRELENNGMSEGRLIRVAGYAATEPLIKEDAFDPKNRRISIKIFPEENQLSPFNKYLQSQKKSRAGNKNAGDTREEEGKDLDPIERYLWDRESSNEKR